MPSRDDTEDQVDGIPGNQQKKFTSWKGAVDFYTSMYNEGQVVCKPIVDGEFDPCNKSEMELAQRLRATSRSGTSRSLHTIAACSTLPRM